MRGSRRKFLASTASLSAASLVGFSGSAAGSEDYDIIRANGQRVTIGRGETYENKLIDLTTGDDFMLSVQGGNSTIRNIGFKGLYQGSDFQIAIVAPRGNVLIENIYLGDGATKRGADFVHGPGAVFYHKDASCDVTFRQMNVQGYTNNAFYCSNTPSGGNVRFESCFGKNNGVSTFRCADGGDEIINCVAYNDNTDYGGGYDTSWVEANGRPVWVWSGGDVTIKDSHFAGGTYPSAIFFNGGSATMTGGAYKGGAGGGLTERNVGNDPDLSPPDGVPMTPEEAAAGEGSGGNGDGPNMGTDPWQEDYDVDHIYELENTGDEPADYFLQVSDGGFTAIDYNGADVVDDRMWSEGDKAAGRVAPGETHCWGMNATMADVTIRPEQRVEPRVDEQASNLDWYPQNGADGDGWKDIESLLGLEPLDDNGVDDGEYEVIEADNSRYFLDDGETFSNKIIDFSNGNWFQLHTNSANDWEIKNVAFRGQHAHDHSAILVSNGGGHGLIENVYMADGCTRPDNPASHGQVGIFVHREHTGHVDIRCCNIQGWPNNGVYGNPPHYADGGSVRIEKCLAANNYVSNFRIGSQGSEIVDSVAYNDGGDYNGRCVWAWGSEINIEGSSFDEGGYNSAIHVRDSTTVNISNTEYTSISAGSGTTINDQGGNNQTSSPDLTPPDCVPMTPEEAVGGRDDSDGDDGDDGGDGEFEEIVVPAGQTHHVALGENESYTNKLIDITANRAEFKISTDGNAGTEIRNIGIRGEWNGTFRETPILAWTEDGSGEVVVENIYFADGARTTQHPNGPAGVFVPAPHAGTVTVQNVNVQGVPYGAVHASAPGREAENSPNGAGGDVIVKDSYAADMEPSAFRVGTDGSRVENCVAVNTLRGGWAEYNNPTFSNCDFSDNEADVLGGNNPYDLPGTATIKNVRGATTAGDVDGSLSGSAQRTEPGQVAGVPRSPEEAARGGGADGFDGDLGAHHDLTVTVDGPDAINGAIEGAEVSVTGETERSATTNSEGAVSFEGLPAGEYGVDAVYDGDFSNFENPLSDVPNFDQLTGSLTVALDEDKEITLSLTGDNNDGNNDGGNDDGNNDGGGDDPNNGDGGNDAPDFGFGDGGDGNPDDAEQLLDALFGEGGLFDSLFGSGGLFDSLFGS